MPEMIQIEQPEPPAIVQELSPIVAEAEAFVITDAASHGFALEKARRLKAGEKAIHEYFEDARKAADNAKKKILEARDGLIRPLTQARTLYDHKAYRFEEAARKQAEAEQRRLQEEARKREEERQLQDAIAAEEAGYTAQAEAIIEQPVSVPTISVVPSVAKVEGVSAATRYSAEVVDIKALIAWVAKDIDERSHYLQANQVVLNRDAVSRREAMNIPGVRAVATQHRRFA